MYPQVLARYHALIRSALAARQEPLGRARATRAALIPVKKSEAWWDLAHNQYRRAIERHWLVAE